MRFLPILLGFVLISTGLSLYYGITVPHSIQSSQTRQFSPPEQLVVSGTFRETKPLNVSISTAEQNNPRFIVNITVTSGSDNRPSQLDFRIAASPNVTSCLVGNPPAGCAYDSHVSNSTVEVPLTAPASYWLIFDNSASDQPKLVSYAVAIRHDFSQTTLSKDGLANSVGICLTIVGGFGVVYGVSRKTVIPWE